MSFSSFVLLSDVLIVKVIGVELGGVVVVIEEFVVPVDLIGKSAFLDEMGVTAPSLMSSTGVWQ